MKTVFDYFVFTSLFIACCALLMVYQTYHLFNVPPNFTFFGFVLSGTMCSYNFHWFLTPPIVNNNTSPKTKWNLRNKPLHFFIFVAAFIASGYFFYMLRHHWFWLCASALLTFLYTAPKLNFFPFVQLRKVAIGKTIFLSLAWTHITVMLPLLISGLLWKNDMYLFSVNRFLLLYAICIIFDLRDRENDKKEGIRSLITVLDEKGNMRLFWGVMVLFFATSIWLCFYFPIITVLALTIPGIVVAAYSSYFRNTTSDYIYYFVLDGLMALSLPLLLIFQFLHL